MSLYQRLCSAAAFSFTQSDCGAPRATFASNCTRFVATGEQLQINQPTVYDCDVPASFVSLVPALAAVCGKSSPSVSNRSVTLTSAGGTDFISFAKGASFNDGTQFWMFFVTGFIILLILLILLSFSDRPLPLLGGSDPSVRPPGPVLDPFHRHLALQLLWSLEGQEHQLNPAGSVVFLQNQQGPLQVGRQPRPGRLWGRGSRRLGVCGRHQPEQGGGEARRRDSVSSGPSSVEGLSNGGAAVARLRGRSQPPSIQAVKEICFSGDILPFTTCNSFAVIVVMREKVKFSV